MMKKFILLLTVTIMALIFNSCKEKSGTMEIYVFGISEINPNPILFNEAGKVQYYLEKRGCIVGSRIFTGSSLTDTDNQAKKSFEKSVAKIRNTDLYRLELQPETTFSYSVGRYLDSTNPDSKIIIIDTYKYTAPAAP